MDCQLLPFFTALACRHLLEITVLVSWAFNTDIELTTGRQCCDALVCLLQCMICSGKLHSHPRNVLFHGLAHACGHCLATCFIAYIKRSRRATSEQMGISHCSLDRDTTPSTFKQNGKRKLITSDFGHTLLSTEHRITVVKTTTILTMGSLRLEIFLVINNHTITKNQVNK